MVSEKVRREPNIHTLPYNEYMNKIVIGAVVAVIIVGGGSFYAGMSYGSGQASASRSQYATSSAAGRFARSGTGSTSGGFTTGQIITVGSGSITIQSAMSSSTEIVLVSDSTPILKTVAGSMSDLTAGTDVVVTGTPNSDGSLTAQSIQIRPAGTQGGFGGGRSGAGTQTQ